MKNKFSTLLILLILLAVLLGSFFIYNALKDNYTSDNSGNNSSDTKTSDKDEKDIKKATDFTVYTESGDAVKLSDYFGKPIILNFWASWCGPCVSEMPLFQSLYEEQGEDITLLMVNLTSDMSETKAKATKLIKDNNYSFPVYFDEDADAAINYSISGIPVTYCIKSDGSVAKNYIGALNEERLGFCVDAIS